MQTLLSSRFWPWLGVAALAGAAFSLACRLTGVETPTGSGGRPSVAGALIGESRTALSGYFYEMADQTFHKGVEHLHKRAFQHRFYQRLAQDISPEKHVHLGGQDVREIMPWLWLAIRSNPQDLELYQVTAFWLSTEMGQPEVALQVLREGQLANPGTYILLLEQARINLREGHFREARRLLNAALAFWPDHLNPNSTDAKFDRRSLLLYSALLHEHEGAPAKALAEYAGILALFPSSEGIRRRMADLQQGTPVATAPSAMLHNMLERDRAAKAHCDRDEAEPPEDHADHLKPGGGHGHEEE